MRKLTLSMAIVAALAACNAEDGQVEVNKPTVGTKQDTVIVNTPVVGTEKDTINVPTVKTGTKEDTLIVKTPTVKVDPPAKKP